MEKQDLNSNGNIEPLIIDILDFIDKLDSHKLINLEMDISVTTDNVLRVLITKHFRERQRRLLQNQY
jgi:hypothetical protein